MNREITDKNLSLLLPSKVSLLAQMYVKEHGGSIIEAYKSFIIPILIRFWKKKILNCGIMVLWLYMRNLWINSPLKIQHIG